MQDNDLFRPQTAEASRSRFAPLNRVDRTSSASQIGTILQSADGTIQSCDRTTEQLLGYTTQQLVGTTSFDPAWQTIYPDGFRLPPEDFPAIVALNSGEPCRDVVIGFYRPNGELVWLCMNATPLFHSDVTRPYAVVTTFSEVLNPETPRSVEQAILPSATVDLHEKRPQLTAEQALQLSEERLQLAISSAKLGMWFWDIKPDTLIWTERCKALFGLPINDSPITYEDFINVLHPDDRDRTHAAVVRTMQERVDYDIEYRAVWQDGSIHWIASKGSCIYDAAGEAIRMNGVVIDIDDRKRAELNEQFLNRLDAQLRQLSNADEMLGEVTRQVGQYLQVDRALWHEVDLNNGLSIVQQDWRRQDLPSAVGVHRLSDFSLPDLIALYQSGQPVVVSDVTTYPYTAPFTERFVPFGIQAFVMIPCIYEGQWVGSLAVNASTTRNWRSDEVELLKAIVVRLWSMIERLRASEELQRSEAEFRQLANAMPQIVYVTDAEGVLEFVNDRWSAYTGLTLEQSRDRALMEQVIPPEDSQQLYADFVQAQTVKSAYQGQFRLIQPDGNLLYFLPRAIPVLDESGQIRKWYGTSTDITALKQLEAELRQKNAILSAINESSPTPIFVKDREGRFIFANPATLEALGKSEAEVIGYRACDLYPASEAVDRVMDNDRRIMESGQMEIVEESPDAIRTFLSMKVPYRDEAGQVIGLIGISNDISDRVQLERDRERILQQEQAARETAETANRLKDQFLAAVSHELRTPLNPILGWSRLLQQGKLDEARTKHALSTIERNAQLQAQLIDDLLDISRILRGKLSLNILPVDLHQVISNALETVRLAAEAKSLHFETIFAPTIAPVTGDAGRLQQVVWNLLSNAVKFTPHNGRITVTLTQSKTHAQIRVIDTGKGISPDFLPFVFDHFRQEDGATTRHFGGLGLGLAIAKQIVELHGGLIAAESRGEDQGATFTVQLPLALQPREFPTVKATLDSCADLSGVRIFVVDDEPDSRDYVAFALEQAGAIVTRFSSGIEVLQAIEQTVPDLIVSDIGMPEMNGYLLMQQIRAGSPASEVAAIALTAYAGEFDRQQALQAGFQRHVAKPVDPTEIVTIAAQLCEQTGGNA